jgi:hypothetical protein
MNSTRSAWTAFISVCRIAGDEHASSCGDNDRPETPMATVNDT